MTKNDKSKNIIITGLTSLLTDISSEMIYPIIALYLIALGGGPAVLGMIEGVAESTASILKVFSGALADHIGKRKPLAIMGYSFSSIGKILLYIAPGWGMVFTGRFSDRFGKGVRTAPRDAMISESAEGKSLGKAFGIHRTLDSMGAVLGTLITFFFLYRIRDAAQQSGNLSFYLPTFRTIIILSLIPAALGVLVLFFTIETGTGKKLTRSPLSFSTFSELDRRLQVFLLATLIFTLGNSSDQFILLRASEKDIGFSAASVTLLYLFYNVVYMFISYPAGWLSDKIGRKGILVTGFALYTVTYYLIGFHPTSIAYAMIPYGLYIGMTEGVAKALISELSPATKKATIIGLHATLQGIGLFPASLLGGFLWSILGPASTFIFGGSMTLLSALILLIFM
ncbi:MAG: MFS transporter [Candidatus Atribacteria bacterium]|nr:MFS transporter [Candidatus Atribacteria bacterium]